MSKTYTKEEIEKILRDENFEYHRVDLPFGLHTPGDDRSATRNVIFPDSLAGKSVLDVGCALGYFCFEAEARGAKRVVGVDLKPNRLRLALILKEIKDSKVEFLQTDILASPVLESFDFVLMLNVIHHLKEPVHALRQLAAITRQQLAIEFPTLEDQKFQNLTGGGFPHELASLPLIGVSSLAQADQTFVFNPEAIRRMLLDHDQLFHEVRFLASPIKGRMIALCSKPAGTSSAKSISA